MKNLIFVFVIGMSTIAFGSITADSLSWEGQYGCDIVPSAAGWTETNAGFCSVSGGILTVDSLDTDYAPYWYRNDLTVNFTTGFTMEWKVKYIDGSTITSAPCSFTVLNNAGLGLQGMLIGKSDVMGVGVLMNTQDAFHVYRMTVKDGNASLYVDNSVLPAMQQPIWAGDFGSSMIRFGDVTGDEDAEYQIDYIRWTTAGAFVAVPEPASMIFLSIGVLGLLSKRKV